MVSTLLEKSSWTLVILLSWSITTEVVDWHMWTSEGSQYILENRFQRNETGFISTSYLCQGLKFPFHLLSFSPGTLGGHTTALRNSNNRLVFPGTRDRPFQHQLKYSKGLSQICQGTFVSHDIMEECRLSARSLIKGHITSAPQSPHL